MLLKPLQRFFATATTAVKKTKTSSSSVEQHQHTSHGRLYTWGNAFYGRLAGTFLNKNISNDTPVLLDEIKDVTRVQSGYHHLLVQTASKKFYGVGLNSSGQLGNGNTKDAFEYPLPVPLLQNVVDFSAGKSHSVAVLENGTVLLAGDFGFWTTLDGYNNKGYNFKELNSLEGKNIVKVTSGKHHILALSKDHKVYGMGSEKKGTLPQYANVPYLLEEIDYLQHKKHAHVTKIKSVGTSNMVLLDNGQAYAFGQEFYGNLGVRSNQLVQQTFVYRQPTQVVTDNLHGEQIVDFDLSSNASVFLTHSNRAYYSGLDIASKPTLFPIQPGNIKKVFATESAVGFVTTDNKIHYYVDKIIEDSDRCPKSLMYVSEDASLEGNVVDIGGGYGLRYAVVG